MLSSPTGAVPATEPNAAVASRPKPWSGQGHAERLDTLTGSALDTLKDILDQPTDLNNPKMLSIQKDAALSVLGAKIRVDAGRVRKDQALELTQLLDAMRLGVPATFLDSVD